MRLFLLLVVLASGVVATAGCSMAACGSGMSAAGQGMSNNAARQQRRSNTGALAASRPSCSSDFACGLGERCVKAEGQFNGYCAKTVNEFGTPTYQSPRSDSIGAGSPGCHFDTDCPVGFRCDKGTALSGNCVK